MRLSAVAAVLLLPGTVAAAQAPTRVASAQAAVRAQARPDSGRALRTARGAQAAFERTRFISLPWADDTGWSGHCDEIIGRFCITYDDSEDSEDWTPPAEHARVVQARARLIARLDTAAAAVPGDRWIAGQRVRYLVEAGRGAEAVAAARECRSAGWWCQALEGFAHHKSGDFAAAEASFDAALGAMTERDRREWTDLSRLLQRGEGGAYARTRGAARTAAERRFWWLADPLWMDGSNDRRTEHLSRWVWDRLQDRARNVEGLAWDEDLEEISVRFGLPIGWQKIRPEMHHVGRASVITHYPSRAREFMPDGSAILPDAPLDARTWDLHARRARTDYAPSYVTHFDSLPHQVAVFRRGAEAVVVAGYLLDRDSVRAADAVQAGLVLAVNDSLPMQIQLFRNAGPTGSVRIATTLDSAIVSVEAIARERKRAARARYPLSLVRPAEQGVAVSDLLLLADPAARPRTLEEATVAARSSVRFRPGERIGFYWEVYRDDPRADSLRLSVSLTRRAAGGLRRVVERIGLAGGAGAPVRIRWSEEAGISAILGRSLGVALPPRLAAGEYHLELTVQPARGPAVTRTRTIFVER